MSRRAAVVGGVVLAGMALGCSAHSETPSSTARPSTSKTAPDSTVTLIVKFRVGPHPEPAPLSTLGSRHACQSWNVSAYSYGGSVSVEHVRVGRAEGRQLLARLQHLDGVRETSLADAAAYDRVPDPEPGFAVSESSPCRVGHG